MKNAMPNTAGRLRAFFFFFFFFFFLGKSSTGHEYAGQWIRKCILAFVLVECTCWALFERRYLIILESLICTFRPPRNTRHVVRKRVERARARGNMNTSACLTSVPKLRNLPKLKLSKYLGPSRIRELNPESN